MNNMFNKDEIKVNDSRINTVLKVIKDCHTLVDIGTDHGNLAILARQKNIAKNILATDINKNIIEKLNKKIKELNLNIKTKVSNGFKELDDSEFDIVAILGIGGLNIIEILKNEKRKFNKYFFIPHQNVIELRKYLMNNSYKIHQDFVIKNKNKYYFLLEVTKEDNKFNQVLEEKEIYYGKDSIRNEDFLSYKNFKIKNLKNKLKNTTNEVYINKLKKQIFLLEEIK